MGLETRVEGREGRGTVERTMRPLLVVVATEGVQLGLQDRE
jgi:hypothetical protein